MLLRRYIIAGAILVCLGGVSLAALIGFSLNLPFIVFDNQGVTSYSEASDLFSVNATPFLIVPQPGVQHLIVSSPQGHALRIRIEVDATGGLVGGVPGDDLVVLGEVTIGPDTFSGVLLTGEVVDFGFRDVGGGSTTDFFDFQFAPTGGQLQSLYSGGDIGVKVTSELSNFTGNFTVNFRGEAKGNIGSIPGPECELAVRKTCCIPPPPPAPAGDWECKKPIDTLTMVWNGTQTVDVLAYKGDTDDPLLAEVLNVAPGDEVTVNGYAGSPNDVVWEIFEAGASFKLGESTFHLSCSDDDMDGPEDCGKAQGDGKDKSGFLNDWILEGIVDAEGTLDCTPPDPGPQQVTNCVAPGDPEGTQCDSRLTSIVFEYTGEDCAVPLANPQDDKAVCVGDPMLADNVSVQYTGKDPEKITVSPSAGIDVGDRFSVTATGRDELHSNTKLNIGNGLQLLEIHTSCSQPLALGDVFGSLRVVEFTTKDGGAFTLADPEPPEPTSTCELVPPPPPHCNSKVLSLTLRYLGGDCTNSANSQDKDECSGPGPGAAPVSIAVTKDEDKVSAAPSSGILVGDLVTFSHIDGELRSDTEFDVIGSGGPQSLKIHTSCSQPLNLGDRFGAFEVFAMERKEDDPVSIGGMVEYQYVVTNPNLGAVIVDVVDTPLGSIADDLFLAGGESVTLFRTVKILDSVTNVVDVSGSLASNPSRSCGPVMDSAMAVVMLPPPPPAQFDCDKPIDSLTMIWNGLQNIRVRAWKGDVGSTLLADIDNVMPGDEVTVSGFAGSPNDVFWEIFEAGTSIKVGESTFHLSCSDDDMDGAEDCGKAQGDGKGQSGFLNDWILEGMVDASGTLDCTP